MKSSEVQWSPVESSEVQWSPVESSGIQWNPVESMWIMWGMVKYCIAFDIPRALPIVTLVHLAVNGIDLLSVPDWLHEEQNFIEITTAGFK